MTEETPPKPKLKTEKLLTTVHFVTIKPTILFFVVVFEVLLTLTMMKREPKWPWVSPFCALLLTLVALSGILSIVQNQKSYELTNRFAAYDLLSQDSPSPNVFSKTINELVAIEPIEDLTYAVSAKGLKIEECSLIYKVFGYCYEPGILSGSTHEKEIIFDTISEGIVTTQAYSAPLLQRNVKDSIVSAHAVGSDFIINHVENSIISLVGVRNAFYGAGIKDTTIRIDTERTDNWSSFSKWYRSPEEERDSNLVNEFYGELLRNARKYSINDSVKKNLTDKFLNENISTEEELLLLSEKLRSKFRNIQTTPKVDYHSEFINNSPYIFHDPLFNLDFANDIHHPLDKRNEGVCVIGELSNCFSDESTLRKLSRINIKDVRDSNIFIHGEVHGKINNLSNSEIALSDNNLGYPLEFTGFSGNVNIGATKKGYIERQIPSFSILQGRIYDNSDNYKKLYSKIESGYPHIDKDLVIDMSPNNISTPDKNGNETIIIKIKNILKNLNLEITNEHKADDYVHSLYETDIESEFFKEKQPLHIKFSNDIEHSLIKISSDTADFLGSINHSIIIVDSNTDLNAVLINKSVVHINGPSSKLCTALNSIKHQEIMILNKKCPNLDGITEEQLMAFLSSLRNSKIENNEAAFYGAYLRRDSLFNISLRKSQKNTIEKLSKQFEENQITMKNLHSYLNN